MADKITIGTLLDDKTKTGSIIHALNNYEYSVLDILGAAKLRSSARKKCFLCGTSLQRTISKITRKTERSKVPRNFQQEIINNFIRKLDHCAPVEIIKSPKLGLGQPAVFMLEDPTIGEMLRTVGIIISNYSFQEIIIPVDLNWYEGLLPYRENIGALGIQLFPVISESLKARIYKARNSSGVSYYSLGDLDKLAKKFLRKYLKQCEDVLSKQVATIIPLEPTEKSNAHQSKIISDFFYDLAAKDTNDLVFVPICIASYNQNPSDYDLFYVERVLFCEKLSATKIRKDFFNRNTNLCKESLSIIRTERFNLLRD